MNRRIKIATGNALTVVLLVVLIMCLLVTASLNLSARGRDITASYVNNTSVYNLALAGNEYAISFLEEIISIYTPEEDGEKTVEEIMDWRTQINELYKEKLNCNSNGFIKTANEYIFKWNAEVVTNINEIYNASTSVSTDGYNFKIVTEINKETITETDVKKGYPVLVQTDIIWPLNSFDGYKPPVLKSKRI